MPEEAVAPVVEEEVDSAIDALRETEGSPPDTGEEASDEPVTVEALAQDLGWKPRDDFQGHEDDYVGPDEYIRRSKNIQESMRTHLKENKRKLAKMDQALKDIKVHYDNISRADAAKNNKRLTELRKERDEAIEEADKEKVDAVENEMADLYETASKSMKDDSPPDNSEEREAFTDWHKGNSWYGLKGTGAGNKKMTDYADKLSEIPENKALPYEDRLEFVTEKVREKYPQNFKQRTTPKVNAVETPNGTTKRRKYSARDLTPDQKSVMRSLVEFGDMTEKEYIEDLIKTGDLK